MLEQHTSNSVKLLKSVQFSRNSALNRVIKMSPYKAVFGQNPLVPMQIVHSSTSASSSSSNEGNATGTETELVRSNNYLKKYKEWLRPNKKKIKEKK